MGNSLDDFNIRLEFDHNGDVSKASYWDQAGCGQERVMDLGTPLDDVVSYHLKHYRESHRMQPPKLCGYQIKADTPGGIKGAVLRCVHEKHGPGTNHRFEIRS